MRRLVLAVFVLLPLAASATPRKASHAAPEKGVTKKCTLNGHKLYGKIQIVDAFPDLKVEVVTAFPDLKVKKVDAFPDECGKWEIVDAFPDVKVQLVDAFPDLKIEFVDAFPGLP